MHYANDKMFFLTRNFNKPAEFLAPDFWDSAGQLDVLRRGGPAKRRAIQPMTNEDKFAYIAVFFTH